MNFNFRQDILSTRYIFESKIDLTIIPTSPISSNLLTSVYELDGELREKMIYVIIYAMLLNIVFTEFIKDGRSGMLLELRF